LLTILLSSRVKDNKDSRIHELLGSLEKCGGNDSNCEVLIKYDDDDNMRPDSKYFDRFPFTVGLFTWSRGEGRHGLHLDYFYLFSQRNRNSTFVLVGGDDFCFERVGFIEEILSIKEEYCFVGPKRPRSEIYAGQWRNPDIVKQWRHECAWLPCFSVRCIEVLQNYGWQCNADNWKTLLHIILYEKYQLDLWKIVPEFYSRLDGSRSSGYSKSYNNMEIGGDREPSNTYYYDLVEQQAKNLYLNIIHAKKS